MNEARMPRLKDKIDGQEQEAEKVREKAEKKDIKNVLVIKKKSPKN